MADLEDVFFKNDPIYMKSLIGRKIIVETVEEKCHTGVVYVIDPIFKTVVLHTKLPDQELPKTVFVLFHGIKSIKVLSDEVDGKYLENFSVSQPKTCQERKVKLKQWFKHMFINVEETGEYLKIDDHLVIVPPYGPDNCICNNTIILERIRNIIELMPAEFN